VPPLGAKPVMQNRAALETVMNAVLATKTTEHWVAVLEAADVPCGPVYNYAQMFDDPQVRHRGLVQYASDAELGEVPHIRTPIKIGKACGCAASRRTSASTLTKPSAGSALARRRLRDCARQASLDRAATWANRNRGSSGAHQAD
jgi:crotonobetainyl-CoA:carnitine CoA-transferase CaiB-like acyl-CoA transferase